MRAHRYGLTKGVVEVPIHEASLADAGLACEPGAQTAVTRRQGCGGQAAAHPGALA